MLCVHDRLSRRTLLQLATFGLGLPAIARGRPPLRRVRSVVQLFLWGGPAQQETFDLKPHAPEGIRSWFRPIATRTTGMRLCEHLPRLANLTERFALVRSLTHGGVNHGTSAYHMLTGRIHASPGTLRHPAPDDHPSLGSLVTRFHPRDGAVPRAVSLPSVVLDGDGGEVPGQGPGYLGARNGPMRVIGDPTDRQFSVDSLRFPAGVNLQRLVNRRALHAALKRSQLAGPSPQVEDMEGHYDRALQLLSTETTQRAFQLASEPEALRHRYGWHPFAQSCLLARRLVEAGVPFLTVFWNAPRNTDNQSWDTHAREPERLKNHLLPAYDQAVSAFLEDLHLRGLLEETLVVSAGEFGRTPKINRDQGRDHWGFCQSILVAGGGVRGGQVYGSSDAHAAYAADRPVRPDDLAATMLDALAIPLTSEVHDSQGRPQPICLGKPITGLF